jgi:hypothetical protein
MKELEDYKRVLNDFEIALSGELSMDLINDDMVRLLRREIYECKQHIKLLENV